MEDITVRMKQILGRGSRSAANLRASSSYCAKITTLLVGCVCVVAIFFASQDMGGGDLNLRKLAQSGTCADSEDVLNMQKMMCKVSNSWALAFLRGLPYATCAKGLPGLKILQSHNDANGNFWYPTSKSLEVHAVYSSCTPTCATDNDAYHSDTRMCIVRNSIARMWLLGLGQFCKGGAEGELAITKATKHVRATMGGPKQTFFYPPSASASVRRYYATCQVTCALGDRLSPDGKNCLVENSLALEFFRGRKVCSTTSDGVRLISDTQDGGHYYPRIHGASVQSWYNTCRQGRESMAQRGADAEKALSNIPKSERISTKATRAGAEILFPYPATAQAKSVTICNYSGKDYFYANDRTGLLSGGGPLKIPYVTLGQRCTAVSLSVACEDSDCWKRGHVSACSTSRCFSGSSRQVTAGISVISDGAGGSALCSVMCTASPDVCKTTSVLYISPAHCSYVQVLPTKTNLVDFPPPYENLPKITFPYPDSASADSITLCNYSGEEYWYSTDDKNLEAWRNANGHALLRPLSRGGSCVVVKTSLESWHRGYVAPCRRGEGGCHDDDVRTITAGINVVNIQSTGQSLCAVPCTANVDSCKTSTVVYISPSKCDKVHVATI